MTGQELFAALSFVDERYVMEAEKAYLGGRISWAKWLSVAACLCILIAGTFALGGLRAEEEAAAPAAPEAIYEEAAPAAMENAAAAPREEVTADDSQAESAVEPVTIPGELHQVPFAHLRILEIREDGSFTVFVERVADEPGPFGAGEEMTFVIDSEMIPAPDRTNLPYDGTITVDMLVEIQNGVYDAGIHTLYAEGVVAAARE